jgi:hypothetical protein
VIDRRAFLGFALAAFVGALPPSAAHADPAFKHFLPLLIDIDGWQGKKPDGMSMDMGESSITTATREYERGPARLHASVMIGAAAAGALASTMAGMNIETTDGHMITSTINGLKATRSYNTKDKSGTVLVALGENALFSVSYNGLTEEEALPLAQKFDWKAIQAAARTK